VTELLACYIFAFAEIAAGQEHLFLQALCSVVLEEGLRVLELLWPSTVSPAISPRASAWPSRVVTTPILLSGMSIAFASSARNNMG
jgi:hypothetical protein